MQAGKSTFFFLAAMGAVTLGAHTAVKQIIDFSQNIFGTFSTVGQTMVAACLGQNDRATAQAAVNRILQIGLALGLCTSAVLVLAQVGLSSQGLSKSSHCILAHARGLVLSGSAYCKPCLSLRVS